ncbi:hypothetical protein [Paenibacillus swuensis]|uniref:hypothetical protein n=1 Tax=Paenibacillus swuensis TaxID=1178515 RepID=UPI0018D2ADF7|nr:hypothetical protein [Paenibacillus swuensis]
MYKHVGENIGDLPSIEEYQFIVGVYDDVLKSGNWPLVDSRPFRNDNEKWPSSTCIIDSISGEYFIYYKGEMLEATKEQCEGMEIAAVWEA